MTGPAEDFRQEFTKVGESLAATCADMLAEFTKAGDWPSAGIVAEQGDLVGFVLASLARIAGRLP